MSGVFDQVMALLAMTLRDPQAAAQVVMRYPAPMQARWLALLLIAVVSALLIHFTFALQPSEAQAVFGPLMASPIRTTVLQWLMLVTATGLMTLIGRWRGGSGAFPEALSLVVWLQMVLMVVQVAQLALFMVFPPLADLLGMASLVLFLWLLTQFTCALHGFRQPWLVFAGIVVTAFGLMMALSVVLALILAPMPGGM